MHANFPKSIGLLKLSLLQSPIFIIYKKYILPCGFA